jgi:hypothetical protein
VYQCMQYGACTGDRVGLRAGRLFYSTFDVTYVFPTLRSHKSARAAVQVTTYGRKPRPAVGTTHRRGPAFGYRYMPIQVGTTLSLTTSVVRLSSRARLDTRPRPLSLKPLCVHTSCHVSALPSSPFSRLPPNLTVWLRSKQLRRPVSASAS